MDLIKQLLLAEQQNAFDFSKYSQFLSNPIDIFRGIPMPSLPEGFMHGGVATKQIRQQRRALDSSNYSAAIFNYCFEQKFGVKDIRAKVAFITRDMKTARRYGQPVLVMPGNTADVYFSPRITDSYIVTSRIDEALDQSVFNDENVYDLIGQAQRLVNSPTPSSGDAIAHALTMDLESVQSLREIIADVEQYIHSYQKISASDMDLIPTDCEAMILDSEYAIVSPDWLRLRYKAIDNDVSLASLLKRLAG